MAVETLAAFRAADKGLNVRPTILAVKGSDGEIYVPEVDPATGAIPVTVPVGAATEATSLNILAAVDGVETLITSTNSKLDTIAGHVDQIEGYVDGIETLIGTTNTNTGNVNTVLSDRLSGSLVPAKFDYISYTDGGASETYVYKTGGSGGTTVKTLTIVYTDATKAVLVSVAAT